MKKAFLLGLALAAALVAALLLLPPWIDLGAYKAHYLPLVAEALQRKVDVGEVRLRIIPTPSIRVSTLAVSDNPAFSAEPFFSAQRLIVKLKLQPLLRGQFQVDELVLEKPSLQIIKKPDGALNLADIGNAKAKGKEGERKSGSRPGGKEPARLSDIIPAKVRIQQGEVTLQTLGQKPVEIEGIHLSLDDFSIERPFSYRLALQTAGLSPVSLEGRLRYDESRSSVTLLENNLKVQGVDFPLSGSIAELTAVPRLNLSLGNDGFETRPIFRLLFAAGVMPKEMEVSGPLGLRVSVSGPSNILASYVEIDLKGLEINHSRAFRGTAVGKTSVSFLAGAETPLDRTLAGSGTIAIKDGALTNVDLISRVREITGLIGLSQEERQGATTFKTLEVDFTLGQGVAEIKRIYLQSPAMEANGSGKMTLALPALDLSVDVALARELSARATRGGAATFFEDSRGRIVVPLIIRGPVQNPSVSLDSGKLVQKGVDHLLERFFRRR